MSTIFLSMAIAVFSVALIISRVTILNYSSVLICAVIFLGLASFSLRFPKMLGLPLLILFGAYLVAAAFFLSYFPSHYSASPTIGFLKQDERGVQSVAFYQSGMNSTYDSYIELYDNSDISEAQLECRVVMCAIHSWVPFVGADRRVALLELRTDGMHAVSPYASVFMNVKEEEGGYYIQPSFLHPFRFFSLNTVLEFNIPVEVFETKPKAVLYMAEEELYYE